LETWIIIDDNLQEATAFAEELTGLVRLVKPSSVSDARESLAGGVAPSGILMDVDLSNDPNAKTTGPGLTSDCRVWMQEQKLPAFPIVRFSFLQNTKHSIGHDPTSDDLFDLMITKEQINNKEVDISARLSGLCDIYDNVAQHNPAPDILLINERAWEAWGHPSFAGRLAQADRPHLRAGLIVRLLTFPGLLISEELLSFRLGVDPTSAGWTKLLAALSDTAYRGVASKYFPRWWARGVSDWWAKISPNSPPLAGTTISERVEKLSGEFCGLIPLTMPPESEGDKPWRFCILTKERTGRLIPVDPSKAVRVQSRGDLPPWFDPLYAATGPALEDQGDPRLDLTDLERRKVAHGWSKK
jgi:hypothetical protein